MKLPAVWLVAAFAAGILLRVAAPVSLSIGLAGAALLILSSILLLKFSQNLWIVWLVALCAWVAIGFSAAAIEHDFAPAGSIAQLIDSGRIDASEPLRWRGRLREEPMRLLWGERYEIDLESVEVAAREASISGGLRVNYYTNPRHQESLPVLRAGDRVEALLRARLPRNFMNPGAFDLRGLLAREAIDVVGSLRSAELLRKIDAPPLSIRYELARIRGALLERIDSEFGATPDRAAVLRAMLLGDRTFVDSKVSLEFQKTGAYHVLVVAGLHVGALCVFLLWLGRKLHARPWLTALVTLAVLAAYVGIVQDRPPILRAALMAGLFLAARPLRRHIELLNTVAVAALMLLFWHPSALRDASFELSFLAAGVIAGLALPWIDRTAAPYLAGLNHLGDVTRDLSFAPRVAQFRLDLRVASNFAATWLPAFLAGHSDRLVAAPIRFALRLWEMFVLSFALQCGMLALLALEFHRVSLAGPLSNIPAVLLTGVIVPIGFLTLWLSFVWQRLASVPGALLGVLVKWLLASVHWFAVLPRVSYRIPDPPVWLMVGWMAALVGLCAFARANRIERGRRRRGRAERSPRRVSHEGTRRKASGYLRAGEKIVAGAFAVLTLAAATYPFRPRIERGKLQVTVLDVGQGDSIFAAFPDGRTMLVDGGGEAGSERIGGYRAGFDVGEQVVAPYLWSRGIKRIDVVTLTHAHHDHLDGLHAVLNDFRVGELWVGPDVESKAYEELIAQATSVGVRVVHKRRPEDMRFGGVEEEVLWPGDAKEVAAAANNDSVTLRICDGEKRFLLTGDIEQKAEKELITEGAPLAADFLKVPHHGSKTSSTEEFLAAVAPRVAVVSVGEGNVYGQPNPAVLERYERDGVRLLRTDRDGAVTATTDGHSFDVTTYRESHRPE
ncbi:MAG: ComEC/Rec2 family competence protein [Candidatus Acidiferrales bacterium]